MKNLFKNFFKLFIKEPEIVKTKSKDGEKLTEWEKLFLWKQLELDKTVTCPNCESAKMFEGPQGGMSVNIRCPKCGQGINFLWLPGCKDVHALDWCDNIGIDESWIDRKTYSKIE
jgi:transcription elongation factor Elf1